MSVEFVYVATTSRLNQPDYPLAAIAGAHARRRLLEETFGSVLIDGPAGLLTNMDVAAEIAAATDTVGIALTHWSGVFDPVVAARQLATIDTLSEGRLSLRVLAPGGGSEPTGRHLEAVRQTDEYLVLLKRLWCNDRPLDHEGPHYSVRQGYVRRKGPQRAEVGIRMGGVSGAAIDAAGRHATVFELLPGSVAEIRDLISRVEIAASRYGRKGKIRFALPVRLSADGRATPTVAVEGPPARICQTLLDYAALGISEFMVHGLDSDHALQAFAGDIAGVLRHVVPIQVAARSPRTFQRPSLRLS